MNCIVYQYCIRYNFLRQIAFFSRFTLTGHCKISPSPSPYCPYLPFPLLPLFLNSSYISWPTRSPYLPPFSIFSTFLHYFCVLHSFFWHPGSSHLLPPHRKSFFLCCFLFPTSVQHQKYHNCLPASFTPFSEPLPVPCSSQRFLYTLHTLQSSPIIPPAIHSSSWSPSSFCSILWIFLLPENGLVLIFLGKETTSISYLTSWIPFHHQMSLSFVFEPSFSSVLADLKFLPCFLPFRGSGITTSFILNVYLPLLCITNPTPKDREPTYPKLLLEYRFIERQLFLDRLFTGQVSP